MHQHHFFSIFKLLFLLDTLRIPIFLLYMAFYQIMVKLCSACLVSNKCRNGLYHKKYSLHLPLPNKKNAKKTPDIGNLLAVSQKDDSHYKAQIRVLFGFENTKRSSIFKNWVSCTVESLVKNLMKHEHKPSRCFVVQIFFTK